MIKWMRSYEENGDNEEEGQTGAQSVVGGQFVEAVLVQLEGVRVRGRLHQTVPTVDWDLH
jgi:hypothetical protein